jgi:hypothetical protein
MGCFNLYINSINVCSIIIGGFLMKLSLKNSVLRGTIILTLAGILTKIIGFFYRIYLALLSAVAFTLWTILLKYNKIGRICIYNFVIPVSGIFLAGIVLHEDIWHLRYFSALLLVSAGIIIVNSTRGNNKEKSGSESGNA